MVYIPCANDLIRLGFEVIFERHSLGATEEIQDDDAAHVHLGQEPPVVCNCVFSFDLFS